MGISDEETLRFMDESRRFHGDTKEILGRLIEGQKNNGEHISAVSRKVDATNERFDQHTESIEAHGIGAAAKAEVRAQKNITTWTAFREPSPKTIFYDSGSLRR